LTTTSLLHEVLTETSTDGPWYVVPADRNWIRNLAVAELLVGALRVMDRSYRRSSVAPACAVREHRPLRAERAAQGIRLGIARTLQLEDRPA